MVRLRAYRSRCHDSSRVLALLALFGVCLLGQGWGVSGENCPDLSHQYGCTCMDDEVRCESMKWTDLPEAEHFPSNMKKLYLAGNKLKKVNFSNNKFNDLELLDLSYNELESNSGIGKAVRDNLQHLKKLYLQGNKLQLIDASYLTGTKIEVLNLTSNPVAKFDFKETEINEITHLYLSEMNFPEFPIDALKVFPQLLHLDLSSNNISSIGESAFSNNKKLKTIHLENNNLSTLSESLFDGVPNLKEVYLGKNHWICDCNLLWLRKAVQDDDSIFKNKDNIKCTHYPTTALRDVATEKFVSSGCHKLAKRGVPDTLQFDPKKESTDKQIISGSIGPATCIQENQKSLFVTYSWRFNSTDDQECQQKCFNNETAYFNLMDGECLCGDINENCTCAECSKTYDMNFPGAKSTTSGLKVNYTSPVVIATPVTISLQWVISANHVKMDFGDGSHVKTSSSLNFVHTFQYPGIFHVTIGLCSSTTNCRELQMDIYVLSLSDTGTLKCPSNPYVNTTETLVLEAEFTHGYGSEIVWSRHKDGVQDSYVKCQEGQKLITDGHCFNILKTPMTWSLALEECQGSNAGSLAVVDRQEISSFLMDYLKVNGVSKAWIGLKQSDQIDNYGWTNGQLLGTFMQLTETIAHGDCVYMTSSGNWETESCNTQNSFICEYIPNSIVKTTMHIAGSREIGDTHEPPVMSKPDYSTKQSYNLIYMPGLWFVEEGVLHWITYRQEDLHVDTLVMFVLYRPVCPSGKTLHEPGCGQNQFFSCADYLQCITRPSCPSDQQMCYLDPQCISNSDACSCAGRNPSNIDCGTQPIVQGEVPSYKPVGNISVTVMRSSGRLMQVKCDSVNLQVQKGDFLGLMYEGDKVPVTCSENQNSKWRQLMYTITGITDANQEITLSGSTMKENYLCEFNALYTKPKNVTLPSELATFPNSGQYIFKYKAVSSGSTQKCQITAMEPVGDIVWVDPHLNVDTIKVEMNTPVTLVAKVTAGSDLVYEWMIGDVNLTNIMHLSQQCPADVDQSLAECTTTDTTLDKPFTSVTHSFTSTTTLKLRVYNKVSTRETTLKVILGPCMPIQGLTLCHESCNISNGCASPCRPLVKVGSSTSFKVMYTQGGVSGKYIYFINDTKELETQDSNYATTFSAAGEHIVKVNMTCDSHSDTAELTLSVKHPANFADLKVSVPSGVIIKDDFVARISAAVNDGAEVNISVDFGDGKPPKLHSLITSGGKLDFDTVYQYEKEKHYNITFNIIDPFTSETLTKDLYALAAVHIQKIDVIPKFPMPDQEIKFAVDTKPISGNNVILAGTYLTYNWTFAGDSIKIKSDVLRHSHTYSFSNPGAYNVSLAVANIASEHHLWVMVTVEECITGLNMQYNGPVHILDKVNFTATVTAGTNITYSLDVNDGKDRVNQSSPIFKIQYDNPGIYNTSLIATNDLTSCELQRAELTVYVINDSTLFLLDILPDKCFKSGESGVLAAKAIHVDPAKLTYKWDFGNGTTESAQGLLNVSIEYDSAETYKISVSHKDNPEKFSRDLCIQDEIKGLVMIAPSPISIISGKMTKEKVNTTVKSGSDIKYQWMFNGVVQDCDFTYCDFNLKFDGNYRIGVNASNNVSFAIAEKTVEALYVIETLIVSCQTCKKGKFLSTLKDAEIAVSTENATSVSYQYNFGSGYGTSNKSSYANVGVKEICVNATNKVSTNVSCIEIITQEEIGNFTVISNTSVDGSNIEVEVTSVVLFTVNFTIGTNVTIHWDCGDGTVIQNDLSSHACHFDESKLYEFAVFAVNEVSRVTLRRKIYVIKEILTLRIAHNLFQGRYAATGESQNITAEGNTYLRVTYIWQVFKSTDNNTAICNITGKNLEQNCNTFSIAGLYFIKLFANNSINSRTAELAVEAIERIKDLTIETGPSSFEINKTVIINARTTTSVETELKFQWRVTRMGHGVETLSSTSKMVSYFFEYSGKYEVKVNTTSKLEPEGIQAEKILTIEEPISGVRIISSKPFTFLKKSSVATFSISKSSGTDMQFKWTLSGPNTFITDDQEEMTHTFAVIGEYSLKVEVGNQVSNDTDVTTIYVEEEITDVNLVTNSSLVDTKTMVMFSAVVTPAGDYMYNWTVNSKQLSVTMSTFYEVFPHDGVKIIKVYVHNNVSGITQSKEITVQEAISGLEIRDCDPKVTQEATQLYAVTSTGSDITYKWTITEAGGNSLTDNKANLTYSFASVGFYRVALSAVNNVSAESVNCTIKAQGRVKINEITVHSDLKYMFVNRTIYFKVFGSNFEEATINWSFNGTTAHTSTDSEYSQLFEQAGTYVVQVEVSNEVGYDLFTKTFEIHVLDCTVPVVTVVSNTSAVKRSRYFVLAVSINTNNCTKFQSKHSWKIYRAASCNDPLRDAVDLGKTYTESPTLHLKARTLPIGSYCAVFNTSYLDTFVHEKANITLTVQESDLEAVIDGGSERQLSKKSNVTISCKNSNDPDDPASQLLCQWSCESVDRSKSCPWETENSQSFVTVFPETGTYTVSLTVTDSTSARTATAQQMITVVSDPVPSISIECVSCRTSGERTISKGLQVSLSTTCANCDSQNVEYSWIVITDNSALVLTADKTLTGIIGSNLVIKEGVMPQATHYKITVSAKFESSTASGTSSLILDGNSAPSGGSCSVTPKEVFNLEEPVSVSCSGWSDNDGDQLYYQILVKSPSSNDIYSAYYGAYSDTELYLASVSDTDSELVHLEARILDSHGAYAAFDLNQVRLKSPTLDSSTTKTEYIFSKSQATLPALLKQNNPSLLLPYVIALSKELNLEYSTNPGLPSKEKRATIRDAITMSLIAIPVSTLEDVQQVAYLLQLLTKYFDEYQTESCHFVIVESLKNITTVLQGYAAQGRNQKHFVPHHLLATISNLIEAVNLGVYDPDAVSHWEDYPVQSFYEGFTNLRPEISSAIEKVMEHHDPTLTGQDIVHRQTVVPSAFDIAEQIVTTILMTTMWLEKKIKINLGGIEVHGQRSKVKEIVDRHELEGCIFYLPGDLFQGNPGREEEIFQIMFVHSKNPFTWDYIKNLTINSRVPSLSFKFNSGKPIPLRGLPESKNIKMYMFENIVLRNATPVLNGKDLTKSEYYKPLANLQYTQATVKSLKAKLVNLDASDGADSASGLHIQVRIEVVANSSEEETGTVPKGSVSVYLGSNFQASKQSYTEYKHITTEDMAEGVDHRNYTFFVSSQSFVSNKKYSLSVFNDDPHHDVNISVAVYYSTCQFFNTNNKKWDSSGCYALDESITTVTACKCNHLTSFGSSMLAPPSVIDITDLVKLDLSTNPVVFVAIGIILTLYIVLVVVFHKFDRLDLKRISMIPLCGEDGSHKFEVTVVTGRQMSAGSSAHIGIKLYGHDAKGAARHLTKQGAFQRNCSDTFIVAYDRGLGNLYKILIWHDNAGLSPSWYLSHVIVKDLYNSKKYFFIGNAWLSVEQESGILKKEIQVATEKQLKQFTTNFRLAASHGFADRHLWLSLMDRPDHSRFTRVQRATCAVTVLLFFMMVNAMWYGVLKTDSHVNRSMADYAFTWEEVVTGLASNVIIFPVALALITLFKKSRSKENTFQQVQKPQSAQTIEIPCDMGMIAHGDWESYYERESTTESIPMAARLKRTQTLLNVNHTFSQDGSVLDGSEPGRNLPNTKSSVASLMRTQHLMQGDLWSRENILRNWPETVPTCVEDERKSTAGTVRGGKTSATSTKGKDKKKKGELDVEELLQSLDHFEENFCQDDKKSKKGETPSQSVKSSGKKVVKDTTTDGLFSSDDDWVNDGLDEAKSSKMTTSRKTINRTPARAAGATAHARFNPREEPKLRGRKTSFSLDDQFSSDDELDRSKVKANKKLFHMNGNAGGKDDAKMDGPQRKTSTSSILKKRDSSRAISAGSSMKETSFMNQPSFITHSEKSKSNMSSIWMRNYYSSNHHMREASAGCMLPSWCVYAAYALCAVISVVSIIIVLLYGYNFGPEVSLKWLLSLLISFFCSALILEPTKVLLIAMYLAARKKDVQEEIENEFIDILPSVQSNETFKDVKSRPLGGFALLQAREEGHKIQRMHLMIRQFVSHMFLLSLLLAISFVNYNPHCFITTQHVQHHLQQTGSAGSNLSMIRSIPDFKTWTETVLADTLHHHELLPLEQFGILLGPARLRQIRSLPDECVIKSHLNKLSVPSLAVLPCDSDLTSEDSGSYSEGWTSSGGNVSWRYHTPQELDMRSKFGQELLYPGGGYIMPLGITHNETLSILEDLFNKDWINLRTRAVFVEFTLYNAGLDLTTAVSVLIEFPITGGVLTSDSISTQKLLRYINGRVDPLMVCEVLFFLCIVYLVVHLALTIRDQKKRFIRSFWNWLDLLIILLAIVCVSLYIVCVVTATDSFGYYAAHKNGFTNFEKSAHLHDIMRQMHAWLLFMFFLKIVHQLRFIKYFHVYGKTISAMLGKVAGCVLIFVLLLLTYAQLGYLYFGMMSRGFASFHTSVMTLFGVIRGSFNFWTFLTQWPIMTHFYFYSFYMFSYGLFIALVIAVMNDTYKMTRQSMYYKATLDTQDYEMIEFIMKRFKLWTGITKQKPAFRRVKFKGLPSLPSHGSTSTSSMSRRSSITSTSSNGEPVMTEAAALHLEHQLDNALPRWENMLSRFNKIEKLEKEEDQQMKKIVKEFKNWETKKASPKRKPPLAGTAFQRFQQNFRGKSQMVNKQKGLIGRTSATPPTESPRKPLGEAEGRRPLSDQGERVDGKTSKDQKKQDATKNVRFSKQAW